jgi:hypothetical protein
MGGAFGGIAPIGIGLRVIVVSIVFLDSGKRKRQEL